MPVSSPVAENPDSHRHSVVGRIGAVTLLATFALMGLVFPFPVDGRLWSEVFDLAHAPAFCGLLLVVAGFVDPASVGFSSQAFRIRSIQSGELMVLAGACLMLGFIGELLQALVGRSPSVKDLAANTAGVLSGSLWVVSQRRRRMGRVLLRGIAIAILGLAVVRPILGICGAVQQRSEFPLIASFERNNELHNWETVNAGIARTSESASAGLSSMQVDIFPGHFSGVRMTWPVPDWRGYKWLNCDVQLLGDEPVGLTLKLYDEQHASSGFERSDRFERTIEVRPGQFQTLRIRLADVVDAPVTRSLNLEQVAGLELFVTQPTNATTVFVDNIRLVGEQGETGIPIDRVP